MHDIKIWLAEIYEKASEESDACEQAFKELQQKVQDWEAVRVEEGCWPLARGRTGAIALDLWYNQESAWRKSNPEVPVAWIYTEDDSDDEGSEDEAEDESDASASGVRGHGQRRRRRPPPHPRRSRTLPLQIRAKLRILTRNMSLRMMKC